MKNIVQIKNNSDIIQLRLEITWTISDLIHEKYKGNLF